MVKKGEKMWKIKTNKRMHSKYNKISAKILVQMEFP